MLIILRFHEYRTYSLGLGVAYSEALAVYDDQVMGIGWLGLHGVGMGGKHLFAYAVTVVSIVDS